MTILDELIEKYQKSDLDEQLRIICDQIFKEEVKDPEQYEGPSGSNIFLSLDCDIKGDLKYENYICLEREAQNSYIISHWSCLRRGAPMAPKRVKAWEVKNDKVKKIIKEFADRLQYLKGE